MKNVMKEMIILGVLVIIANSMMIGCEKTEGEKSQEAGKEKTITGKWKEVDGDQALEFSKHGIVTIIEEEGTRLGGDYELIDENQVKMKFPLFGIIVAEISSSGNEMTLTNPFGKVEKYRKLKQIGRATKSNIAGDYTIVTKMPGEEEFKSPVSATLKEDGTGLSNFSGKWEVNGDQLEFCYSQNQDMTGLGGQITTDILRREPLQRNLRKQRKAKIIERIETGGILWSKYYFTGDRLNASLEIRKDGTFRELWVARDAWRIKDGGVEITIIDENQKEKKLRGEIEGDTIVFQDGETEFRYIKVENVSQQTVVGKYVFEGGIAGEKAEKEPGVFVFNKDGTISYVPSGKRKIETPFIWEIVKEVVQICEDGEILFSDGRVESDDIVFDKFGTTARFMKKD